MPVRYEEKGRVVVITLDRQEAMNAMNPEMAQDLAEALELFDADEERWVGIITGAGDKSFCAGADLVGEGPGYGQRGRSAFAAVHAVAKPLIAAVNGYCMGGGLAMAAGCDVRIASDTATFSPAGTRRGVLPGGGQTSLLPLVVGMGRALELLMWGDRIDAQEAWRIGLVNRVVPLPELMPQAIAWAESLCERAPLAVRGVKKSVRGSLGKDLEAAMEQEAALSYATRQSEDFQEGRRAFAEKRAPNFQAR